MKRTILILIFLLFANTAIANFEKFEIEVTKIPAFIKPMISLIAKKSTKDFSHTELKAALETLSRNFESYPATSTKVFFMTEFFKSFLQLEKHVTIKSTFSEVSMSNLVAAQKKLKDKSLVISKMSEFLMVEILLSYQSLINKEKDSNSSPSFNEVNTYLGSWVGEFLKRSVDDFDELVASVSLSYLKNMVKLSKLMAIHTAPESKQLPLFKNLESLKPSASSQLESNNTTEDESSELNSVEVLPDIAPTAGASERIEALIEEVDENKQ